MIGNDMNWIGMGSARVFSNLSAVEIETLARRGAIASRVAENGQLLFYKPDLPPRRLRPKGR